MAKLSSQFTAQPSQAEMQPVLQFFNAGKLAEAEAAANKLVARYPHTFILYQVLGLAQDGLGRYAQAVENYAKALAIQPNTPDLHFNLGIA
ncbi:MAG TPA: tetratricopeptide repeat protein, partial [Methylotenera sp.]|nr:tetratricopeptide repeat protein [Methylotenera sp.]HPH05341.1 tetratricopeptide repeat protein [Methylotenera sp.]HPN01267.1 tetratricopeptide repeat protein [Methylotenera sp.]